MRAIALLVLLLAAFSAESQDVAALSVSTNASDNLRPPLFFTVFLRVDNFSPDTISPEVRPMFEGGLPPLDITGINGPCQFPDLGQLTPFTFLTLPFVFDPIAANDSALCAIEYKVESMPTGEEVRIEYFLQSIGVDPEPANNQGAVTLGFASIPMPIPTLRQKAKALLVLVLLFLGMWSIRRRDSSLSG